MTTIASINSPDRVIRFAAQDAGFLVDGQDPTPEQYVKWWGRLQDLMNFEQTQGLKLWLLKDFAITLIQGKQFYIIGPGGDLNIPRPISVVLGYWLDQSNNQRPLIGPLSWQEYTGLSNVIQQGALSSFFVDKQATFFRVAPWLVPDAFTASNGTMHLVIGQYVTQLVSLTDNINFPQEWFLFLHWALCEAICTGQPDVIVNRAEKMCAKYRKALEDFDVETGSTYLQPDMRMAQYSGKFK